MRTASEFNEYYSKPDPWGISRAWYRDNALRRCIAPLIDGRAVFELGCGEGHLTETVFCGARSVMGVDISQLAIDRARARNLPYASFVVADFLDVSLAGFDVITAIECLYYLADSEQDLLLAKLRARAPWPVHFVLSDRWRYPAWPLLYPRWIDGKAGRARGVSQRESVSARRVFKDCCWPIRPATWQPSCARLLAEPAYLPAPLHREVLGATRRP